MTEAGDTAVETRPPAERHDRTMWLLVGAVSLIAAGMAAYEIAPASVTPLVRESLGVGATAAGLLVGVMFGVGPVVSLPAGALLDRTNSRHVMVGAAGLVVAMGVWGWWAAERGDYGLLLASRVIAGIGFTTFWNGGIDVVSEAADDAHRATAVGVFSASGPLGFAIGQGGGPLVAAQWGWPAVLVAFTGLILAGLVVFWPTSRGLGVAGGSPPSLGEFATVLRNRGLWLVGAMIFLSYALYLFVNTWGPSYLTGEIGLSLAASGLLVAVFPAVGIVSRAGGGALSDRLFDGRRRPVVLVAFVVATPLLLGITVLRSVAPLVVALLVSGFAIQLMIGLSFAYARELVDPRGAGTAVGFLTALGLGGGFVSPIVGGAIIDAVGFTPAFLLAAGLGAVGVVIAWRAPEPD